MNEVVKIRPVINGWIVTNGEGPNANETVFLKNEAEKVEDFVGKLIGTREIPKRNQAKSA
jgi:hypothetical protein